MGNYAIIWTTNRKYMPGTNGILNALEVYGMDIDVYVMTMGCDLTEEYMNEWPRATFKDIETFWPVHKPPKWYLLFADVWETMHDLLDKYDVVLIWGADACVVNDITWAFEVAEKMDCVIVGTNEFGAHPNDFSRLDTEWPYRKGWMVPYADLPFFITPSHKNVLTTMLDYHSRPDNVLSHMNALNYSLRDNGTKMLSVPGEMWVFNRPEVVKLRRNEQYLHYGNSASQLQTFHRKYWMASLCRKYHVDTPIARFNKKVFNDMWNFFNRECRVEWTEGLEVWDGT